MPTPFYCYLFNRAAFCCKNNEQKTIKIEGSGHFFVQI